MGVKKLVNYRKPRQNNMLMISTCFFNRFDKYGFSEEVENLRISLSSQNDCNLNLITTEEEVRRIFASQNPSKAAGPDKVSPRVLKLCSNQLAYIFSVLYNMCYSDRSITAI